jgi:hypothetical protein
MRVVKVDLVDVLKILLGAVNDAPVVCVDWSEEPKS